MFPSNSLRPGWTPLHEACNRGHTQAVRVLISHGANVNATSECGTTPLIDASANGHTSIIKLLLKHGADPTILNKSGTNAFTCAATPSIEQLLRDKLNLPNIFTVSQTEPEPNSTSTTILESVISAQQQLKEEFKEKDPKAELTLEPTPETVIETSEPSPSTSANQLGITAISELKSVIHLLSSSPPAAATLSLSKDTTATISGECTVLVQEDGECPGRGKLPSSYRSYDKITLS